MEELRDYSQYSNNQKKFKREVGINKVKAKEGQN